MSRTDSPLRPYAESAATRASRPGSVRRRLIQQITMTADGSMRRRTRDVLCTEEPLEIVLAGPEGPRAISVTMRTPGADFDLVAGFLFGEGIVDDPRELVGMRYCAGRAGSSVAEGPAGVEPLYNRVEVRLLDAGAVARVRVRREVTTSSCGVCGKGSIDAVRELACPTVEAGPVLSAELLLSLPPRLREAQSLFERTGGLHAAALFGLDGELLCIREDVGRHNAMDKVVGAALLAGEVPLRDRMLLLSGRLSFELVQKAARAGITVVAAVSAPSTLAVELAEATGITLVGFLRGQSFNIYAGGERIVLPADSARH
jgi:FdhD protein